MCVFRFLFLKCFPQMWRCGKCVAQRVREFTRGETPVMIATEHQTLNPPTPLLHFSTAKCCKLCVWQITEHPSWLLHLCWADGGEQEEKHPDKFVLMGGPLVILLASSDQHFVKIVIRDWQTPNKVFWDLPHLGIPNWDWLDYSMEPVDKQVESNPSIPDLGWKRQFSSTHPLWGSSTFHILCIFWEASEDNGGTSGGEG